MGCGSVDTNAAEESVGDVEQALEPVQPGTRRSIGSLSAAEQTALASAILVFIDEAILAEHANAHDWHHPAVGELFFIRHHDYLNKLEKHLLANGLGRFVPLPEWDPATTIPSAFLVTDPLVSQATLNANPNRPLPAQFDNLCSFTSLSALAMSAESWHDGVHGAVGGAMSSIPQAPGAPIFWLWHAFLDDMHHGYEWLCQGNLALPRVAWTSTVLW